MSFEELDDDGYTLLRSALDESRASSVRERLYTELREALSLPDYGESKGIKFATIHDRQKRDDMCLRMTDDNKAIVSEIVNRFRKVYEPLVGVDAKLCEFGVITSYPGANRQTIHSDVTFDIDARRVYTTFVALQAVSSRMGPTLIWPGTQSQYWSEFYKPRMLGPVDPYYVENPPVEMIVNAGDAVLMDTRVMHAGGQNSADTDRMLFHFSFETQDKEKAPVGFTHNIHPEVKSQNFRLADFLK
jgi:ectoine hydroxylase-related dioxygenase (phytanoyl-CoA dioxygenase family)